MSNPVLIDTHVLLWYAKGDDRLAPTVRELIRDPQTIPYVSKASLWEITIKASLGKLDLGTSFDAFMSGLPKQGFQFLDIEPDDLSILYTLPMHHGDPRSDASVRPAHHRSGHCPLVANCFRRRQVQTVSG